MVIKKSLTGTSNLIITAMACFLLSSILISSSNRLDAGASSTSMLQYKWMATKLPPGSSGAIIGDVNADGIEEILHAGIGRVTLLSGKNGSRLWSVFDS